VDKNFVILGFHISVPPDDREIIWLRLQPAECKKYMVSVTWVFFFPCGYVKLKYFPEY
jgi:hypothetical protein